MNDPLAPYFLGAYGENNDFLEKMLLEFLRDHVFWRRNFHPEDVPPIVASDQYQPQFIEGMARVRQELHQLTASLKRSVPFFHPRYMGHMVSDLLMPGLIAQLVTTLYNPNNIVEDVAPVTVQLELEVGKQLARMLGYSIDPAATPCALGHLASGGTLANDESLWLARAVRMFPLALKDACQDADVTPPAHVDLLGADDWTLLNLGTSDILNLATEISGWCDQNASVGARFFSALTAARIEETGMAVFAQRHPLISKMAVLVPGTAHYSWKKAMKLLGLGAHQLIEVPTTHARMSGTALRDLLDVRRRSQAPVLAVVGVYGTTEFGTFDPIDEIAAARDDGVNFWLHVDAAWGGYVPTVFRNGDGSLRRREDIATEFRHFPSPRVYAATSALSLADSVTVDPHKLGFVPYGAGALVVKDRRVVDLVQQEAPYILSAQTSDEDTRYRRLGRFILEGSKPGAMAAACYVNHRVLPLDSQHFGKIIGRSVQSCEILYDRLKSFSDELAPWVQVTAPFEPDCNVVCLAFNPKGNRSLRVANEYGRKLADAMAVKPDRPVQLREFFGSSTTVELSHLGRSELQSIARTLDLSLIDADDTGLFLLRHTLMNPWLQASPGQGEPSYVEAYCHYILKLVRTIG